MTPDLLPGLMVNHVRVADGGCWEWVGALASNGYGSVSIGGKGYSTHRAAYTALVGEVPDGLQLDHLCRNKACCNPAHLEPVTGSENQRRAKAHITACPKGHAYDEANTLVNRKGQRSCRQCSRESVRRLRTP